MSRKKPVDLLESYRNILHGLCQHIYQEHKKLKEIEENRILSFKIQPSLTGIIIGQTKEDEDFMKMLSHFEKVHKRVSHTVDNCILSFADEVDFHLEHIIKKLKFEHIVKKLEDYKN